MKKFWEKIGATEIRNLIAIIYTLMVLAFIYVLAFKPVPTENKDLVNVLGGTVISGVGLILAYFYGSSKTDNDKNKDA